MPKCESVMFVFGVTIVIELSLCSVVGTNLLWGRSEIKSQTGMSFRNNKVLSS